MATTLVLCPLRLTGRAISPIGLNNSTVGAERGNVPPVNLICLYQGMSDESIGRTTSAPSLLDVNQLADRLCVSTRFVRRLVDERRIPFCKLGKFVRFDPADIDEWVQARRVEALLR
jgi:excisionase family DNA binding protein